MKSTPTQYGRVAVGLHWSIAALTLVALLSGFSAESAASTTLVPLRLHVIAGLSVGFLTLLRIGWWQFADRRPDPALGLGSYAGGAARMIHLMLIAVPVAMAATGIGTMLLSEAGAILFAGEAGPLPDFDTLLPRSIHGFGAMALIAMILIHVIAALYHHLVLRDRLIRRMWFPRR